MYSDEEMIKMYKKSLKENEEHKQWLQGVLAKINNEHKQYFRLCFNMTKAHIKVIVAELTSYKNQDFNSKELEITWENFSIANDNLRRYLYTY